MVPENTAVDGVHSQAPVHVKTGALLTWQAGFVWGIEGEGVVVVGAGVVVAEVVFAGVVVADVVGAGVVVVTVQARAPVEDTEPEGQS